MTVLRPGLPLLESLLGEERCGRPGAARAAALASAAASQGDVAVDYLDATYAAIIAGEPRRAKRLLAQCAAAAPDDEIWRRRGVACDAWIWTCDRNLYPGGVAAEVIAGEPPTFPTPNGDEPETYLVEALATYGSQILSCGVQIEHHVRGNRAVVPHFLHGTNGAVQGLVHALQAVGADASALNVYLFWADALRRAGQLDDALDVLAQIRQEHARLAAGGVAHPTGAALTHLAEGDWFATPGSTPEALGFDLATEIIPSPFLELRDLGRAEAAYDQAAALLADVDQPRAHATLALRRAGLAGGQGDRARQRALIDEAEAWFAGSGDVAGRWVAVAHRLLADIAAGRIATSRRSAGMRFDLEPRGEIAALRSWAEHDGSVSFATGIARLFQRAARGWDAGADHHRAIVAFEMAIPLIPLSGAEAVGVVVLELGSCEARSGLGRRALMRSRLASSTLPTVADASLEPLEWMRLIQTFLDFASGQMNASATAAGTDIPALEWALARSRELMATPGLPPPGTSEGVDVASLLAQDANRSIEELQAAANAETPTLGPLAIVADGSRDTLAFAEAFASLQRGRMAAAIGATETAGRWYGDALEKVRALPAQYAPLEVIIWVARDRFDEARKRLDAIDTATAQTDLLAAAAVRGRDYRRALELFENLEPQGWLDIVDRAEATLGTGEIAAAVELTRQAVRAFEQSFSQMRRDAERVGAADDVKVASLYLVAARALLALADTLSEADAAAASAARIEAFGYGDRARALALQPLVGDDDRPLVLSWVQTTAEWQAAQDRLYRALVTSAADGETAARVAALTTAEEKLVDIEAELEQAPPTRRRPRREPQGLPEVQAALPADVALLEYQVVGRDILIWAVTGSTAQCESQTVGSNDVARLSRAIQQACTNGSPGTEAAELAALLLDPVASVVDGSRRLILVPYGPLNALPFQILPYAGQPLGATHVLSYLPAASLLAGASVDACFAVRDALVVGDPAFDPNAHPELRRLPGAAIEAHATAAVYGTQPLLDADATERTIRDRMAPADLVHLAAHGRLDAVAPNASSIVLAGRDELTVSDLVGLRVDAELAILSACDSGRGAASLGGDVVGLVRGLVASGAKRAIVSLWPVDDAPAAVTMSVFHEELAGGIAAADALHAAQTLVRGLSGVEIAARYRALGGGDDVHATRRRGAPTADPDPVAIPFDPEFADTLSDDEPLNVLDGVQARIWAPFIVVGA